jgi:cytochrome c oxidase assembly factor CtaG
MACEPHHGSPTPWSIAIPATVAVLAAMLLYLRGWRRRRKAFPDATSGCRFAAFVGGMVLLWIVMGSPLSALDHVLLTFHMVQHLLLMTVAAPLILLGTPVVALPREVPGPIRAALRRIGRSVTHPAACWLAGTVVVVAWHVPPMFELGMRSHSWHTIQQATFFAAGLLFWSPVIHTAPGSSRMPRSFAPLYLFLATLPCDALSAFLAFCGRVVYPSHLSSQPLFGLSALEDQECAGALMWFWVTIGYLLPAIVITLRMLSPRKRESAAGLR